MTGAQVAKTILQRMGIHDVTVEQVEGQLTDHYDPSAKAVRLSESVYASSSLAAAAIAAHECGHVLQDVRGYQFMNIRASLVPVANIGANFGPIMVMAGLFLGSLGGLSTDLSTSVLFCLREPSYFTLLPYPLSLTHQAAP